MVGDRWVLGRSVLYRLLPIWDRSSSRVCCFVLFMRGPPGPALIPAPTVARPPEVYHPLHVNVAPTSENYPLPLHKVPPPVDALPPPPRQGTPSEGPLTPPSRQGISAVSSSPVEFPPTVIGTVLFLANITSRLVRRLLLPRNHTRPSKLCMLASSEYSIIVKTFKNGTLGVTIA